MWRSRIVEENVEIDTTDVEIRQSSGKLAGCSSCPSARESPLRHCDNWQGLLDVVGKVIARIIKERFEVIADKVLPESQCGFRKERGCVDIIFVARQLVEKAREHNESLYMLLLI